MYNLLSRLSPTEIRDLYPLRSWHIASSIRINFVVHVHLFLILFTDK